MRRKKSKNLKLNISSATKLKIQGYIWIKFFDMYYCELPMASYKVQLKMSTQTKKPNRGHIRNLLSPYFNLRQIYYHN